MSGVVVDQIWTGNPNQLGANVGGTFYPLGLTVADWQAPLDIVCARIRVALDAATGQTWTFEPRFDASTRMFISCDVDWFVSFGKGLNFFFGYSDLTVMAGANTAVVGDVAPGCRIEACYLGYGLPSLVMEREIVHRRTPVLYASYLEFALRWTRHYQDAPAFDPRRYPFAMYPAKQRTGSTYYGGAWSLSSRSGWLALRPTSREYNGRPLGSMSAAYTTQDIRASWIGGTI